MFPALDVFPASRSSFSEVETWITPFYVLWDPPGALQNGLWKVLWFVQILPKWRAKGVDFLWFTWETLPHCAISIETGDPGCQKSSFLISLCCSSQPTPSPLANGTGTPGVGVLWHWGHAAWGGWWRPTLLTVDWRDYLITAKRLDLSVAAEPKQGSRRYIWDFRCLVCSCVICQTCKEEPVPAKQENVVNWWSWRQQSPPNRAGEWGGRRRQANLHSASAMLFGLEVIELFPVVGTCDISADQQLPCHQDCLLGCSTFSQQFCSHQGCAPPWAGCWAVVASQSTQLLWLPLVSWESIICWLFLVID